MLYSNIISLLAPALLSNLYFTKVIFALFELNISEGPPLMHMNTHIHPHISVEPDWMGLGGVLTALTVTTVRGQTETVTQLI